jgi:hypothetical protein
MRFESSFMASAKVEGFKDTSSVFFRLAGRNIRLHLGYNVMWLCSL